MDSSKIQDIGVTLALAWSFLFWGVLILAFAVMLSKSLFRLAKGQMWRTGAVLCSAFMLVGILWGLKIADISGEIVRSQTQAWHAQTQAP